MADYAMDICCRSKPWVSRVTSLPKISVDAACLSHLLGAVNPIELDTFDSIAMKHFNSRRRGWK
jgi:hypothetical protein